MKENKREFARQQRKKPTKTEKIVWEALRDRRFLDLKFRRQHVIEGFLLDFYCDKIALAIEIDGGVHDNQKEYDAERQKVIESEGVAFIRITTQEINQDINILLDKIKKIWTSFYDRQ